MPMQAKQPARSRSFESEPNEPEGCAGESYGCDDQRHAISVQTRSAPRTWRKLDSVQTAGPAQRNRPFARIAIISPGDPGIGTYSYELAKVLRAAGLAVDIFTRPDASMLSLPQTGAIYPVTGSTLTRQRQHLRSPNAPPGPERPGPLRLLPAPIRRTSLVRALRAGYLSLEFAVWLRLRGYDLVWTQWPELNGGSTLFWRAARSLGLPVIHTAHNVLPHEREPGDRDRYGRIFHDSRAVIVHSEAARRVLLDVYPSLSSPVIVAHHGLYTTYERRRDRREPVRQRLRIPADSRVVLLFGGIRPYKNVDSLVDALASETRARWVLIVAGHESGYPGPRSSDPLARTRHLIEERGVQDRVRLVPGPFGMTETSELFEACDIVALPYTESYGSGQLLLAMSFEKFVVATATGGMDEYLKDYPPHVLMAGSSAADVRSAIHRAQSMLEAGTLSATRPASLEWPAIVEALIPRLTALTRP
jgi:glycosyltransferase involved in cell wall biosynthesis